MIGPLARIARLDGTQRWALGLATWHLFHARLAYGRYPAAELIDYLNRQPEPGRRGTGGQADTIVISWALAAAGRRLPWRTNCLVQALAAKRWLNGLNIPATFHIAAGKHSGTEPLVAALNAHAWLEVDGRPVSGGHLASGMTPFSRTDHV